MRTVMKGPDLSVQTCARRLKGIGVAPVTDAGGPELTLEWPDDAGIASGAGEGPDGVISWHGPVEVGAGSEATVQARCGLMHLHGRDWGGPKRIGVEIASVAAGVLAAHGLMAAAIGRYRGRPVRTVSTSVLQAGLLQASHYIAAATCPEQWVPAPPGPAPGPPFQSADGGWFEIETLDPEAWKAFWVQLGGPDGGDLGRGWTLFRPRYYRGTTSLPNGFHEATRAMSLDAITEVARACGVSLCPVRSYDEVVVEPGRSDGHPGVQPLVADHSHGASGAVAGSGLGSVTPVAVGDLPLTGIEVVEATSRMQGPLAGLLLQMLGARVTRVEPSGGDVGRGVPPLADDTGSFFLAFNRGKGTVELDLGSAAGRGELAELAASADVFLHNWRPGKAEEWGLSADDLARRNPALVYTAASGWDENSSAAHLVGVDYLVQAYCGLGYGINPDPEPPFPSRVLLTDFMGALNTAEGMLAGLYRRERHGHGCRVRTSLQGGGMALGAHIVDGVAEGDETGRRRGRPIWGPLDVPVRAADGFVALSVDDGEGFERLCQVVDVDAAAARPIREQLVVERIGTASAAEWERRMGDAGLACAAVVTELALLADDCRLAPLFEPLAGTSRAPATPWRFD